MPDGNVDQARKLLARAKKSKQALNQRLLVAAAFSLVMQSRPIVVGGTAEEFWTRDEYHPTDLDLIPQPTEADRRALKELGLKQDGRHWVAVGLSIATEFPHDASFEVRRTSDQKVAGVAVRVIGVDDLYLDRLGQTTMNESTTDQHFASLLAIAITNWQSLDWVYIEKRIAEIAKSKTALGASMRKMHRACRRVARRELARDRARHL